MINYLKKGLIIGIACILFNSCDELKQHNYWSSEENDVAEVTATYGELSTWNAALKKTGLNNAMKAITPLTVFAPSNTAFNEYFDKLGINGLDDLSVTVLYPTLAYHMIKAGIKSENFFNGYVATLSEGPNLKGITLLMNGSDFLLNSNTKITVTDIMANNGVIHIISKVLVPPSIIDILNQNGNFTNLVQALAKTKLDSTLSASAPYTLFAPTDAAFKKFFTASKVTGISDITKEILLPILKHHLITGNITSDELGTREIKTLNGSISIEMGYYSLINNYVNIIGFDLQAKNGIVHVVDEVIIPTK
jgi:transforming growth factor-beta-induced protein